MSELGKCRSCGAPIIWAKTAYGKAMPLDAEPNDKGNIYLTEDGSTALYLTAEERATTARDSPRYLSHFATCPNAKTHRKK